MLVWCSHLCTFLEYTFSHEKSSRLSFDRLSEPIMFSAMAKALEVKGKAEQQGRFALARAPAASNLATSGCGAKRAAAAASGSVTSAGRQLAGESALTAERLSVAKRRAADDHTKVVKKLAKKPAVAESDSQEWREGV